MCLQHKTRHTSDCFSVPPKFETRPEPATAARPSYFKDHREWEVEAILDDRLVRQQRQYLIKWKDFEDPSWLRVSQLQHCAELLRDYQHHKGLALDYWSDSSSSPESQSDEGEPDEMNDKAQPKPNEQHPTRSDEDSLTQPPAATEGVEDTLRADPNNMIFDWGE